MEKDSGSALGGRSERERRQFFKIKAVKPNLQVCGRKRVEVVKILVCRICRRATLPLSHTLSHSLPLSIPPSVSLFHPFRSCFFTHSPCAFRETSPAPRPWRPLSVVKLPHETFLMSNHGDLRPSLSSSLSISPSRLSSSSLSPAPPLTLSYSLPL